MKILDWLSLPGNVTNEDTIWYSENCAIVLDGSSALKGSFYPASVFVKDFINVFSKQIAKTGALCKAVNDTVSVLKKQFNLQEKADASQILPSAAGVFVYETENSIQILTIGDCTAIVFGNFGIKKIYSGEVASFDNKVIRRMTQLRRSSGADICDIVSWDEIRNMLVENRKMMNHPGGYRIISMNMKPISEKDIVSFEKNNVNKAVLYSDGFDFMEKEILEGKTDFFALYQKLRKAEESDSLLNTYPRFKQSDDASIISLQISHKQKI